MTWSEGGRGGTPRTAADCCWLRTLRVQKHDQPGQCGEDLGLCANLDKVLQLRLLQWQVDVHYAPAIAVNIDCIRHAVVLAAVPCRAVLPPWSWRRFKLC